MPTKPGLSVLEMSTRASSSLCNHVALCIRATYSTELVTLSVLGVIFPSFEGSAGHAPHSGLLSEKWVK